MVDSVDVEKLDPPPAAAPRRSRDSSRPSTSSSGSLTEPDRDDEKSRHSQDAAEQPEPGEPSTGQDDGPGPRATSRASSTRSRPISVVSRSKRRGLFGRFTVIPEVDRPYDYTNKTKWTITLAVALAGAGAPIGSSIFYPALPQMALDLNAPETVTNLSVALYMLAMSIFPLWWSSFSEIYGRRTIYIISFTLFVAFSIISALSTSVAMLVVFRLLGGGASASVQAVGAGTIADIWEPRERGNAMGIFYLGPLMGPLLAPIIGGALAQAFGWASTMWCLAIYGGIILIMLFFVLPETLARKKPKHAVPANDRPDGLLRMKTTESVHKHTKKALKFMKKIFIDPLSVLLYLRFPPVAITVYYAAITFGSLFAMNISIEGTYSIPPYDFSQLIVGLLYIPSALGYFLASALGGRWNDKIMAREARNAGRYDAQGKLIYLPEDRMRENAWIAATVYPASLIFYGWTIDAGLFWFVPAIGLFTFGVGSMIIFAAATTMLTEFLPRRSSGGVAVNNFVRNIFSCVGAIVAQPIINAIGNNWLFTILGLFTWSTGYLCIWALKRYGPGWRKSMDKALEN